MSAVGQPWSPLMATKRFEFVAEMCGEESEPIHTQGSFYSVSSDPLYTT